MKYFLFRTIATLTAALIGLNLSIGNGLTSIIANIFNSFNSIIKYIAENILIFIDKDRYAHVSLAASQSFELNELNLLMAANKVKEDAVKNKTWTIGHTIALNKIGNALHISCRWEPARIHRYLKDLVESIPGMVYMSGGDYDEDDKSPV